MAAEAATERPAASPESGELIEVDEPDKRRPKSRNLRPLIGLVPLVAYYRGRLALALLSLLVAALAMLAVPLAVRRVIDHGFTAENAGFVDQYFAMMLVIVAMLAVGSAGRYYFVTWLGERVVADLRRKVFRHLLSLSPGFYDAHSTGETMSRLTADTTQLKSLFGASISVALRNLFMLAGSVVMMVVTSLELSALVLLVIPLIVLPLVLTGRRVRRLSREAQDTLARSAGLAQESLGAVPTIQAYGQTGRIRDAFARATEEAFAAAGWRTAVRAWLTAAIIFIAFGSVVGVLWYGAQAVLAGEMTGGALGQFVLYAALAALATGALSEIWGEIQLAAGAAERLAEILDMRPAIEAPANPRPLPWPPHATLAFEDVHFAYPMRPHQKALRGASFKVDPGERVAIVGPSGAGKSTIFNLILRFYDPQGGRVLMDGVDVAQADPADVRARIASVPQETMIFSSTVAENIRFGRPDASEADIEAAAQAAQATEFIERLPQGFATKVGERGVMLSGGQRQRIAIARAILRDAPILLLDEATSALDAESESLVQTALERLMKGRTSLVIAHRLATVRTADRIIVLDRGRVVAQGRHGELMGSDGLYARLAKLQFSDPAAMAQ
jgi:ATP-binding cassette, subfamily B, bacterial